VKGLALALALALEKATNIDFHQGADADFQRILTLEKLEGE
jgi:hypothetical protein